MSNEGQTLGRLCTEMGSAAVRTGKVPTEVGRLETSFCEMPPPSELHLTPCRPLSSCCHVRQLRSPARYTMPCDHFDVAEGRADTVGSRHRKFRSWSPLASLYTCSTINATARLRNGVCDGV